MKKIFFPFVFLFCAFSCVANGEVDMNHILSHLKSADKDTIVVFDCDDVLIETNDLILRYKNKETLNRLYSEKSSSYTDINDKQHKEIYDHFYSIVMRDYKTSLVDPRWPKIIDDLQKRQIKVLLLTACRGGKVGNIKSMSGLRRKQLLDVGIDFSKSWEHVSSMKLMESDDILFENGMIFSGEETPKCDALQKFLEKTQCAFKKMIFIDDRMDNIKDVEKAFKTPELEFIGLNYEKGNDNHRNEDLDIKKAEKQVRVLIEKGKWISESEIDAYCDSK